MLKKPFFYWPGLLLLLTACIAQPSPLAKSTAPQLQPTATEQRLSQCQYLIPANSSFGIRNWPDTDFCRHNVPYAEIRGLVARDKIAALDEPTFENVAQANIWLTAQEPVLLYQGQEEARAYPLPILIWHEIVNDTVGDLPIVVTYCPLCNSALIFERRVNGRVLDFGTTGNLRHADLVMYDRQTESWWQQFEGAAIVGELTGSKLTPLPASIITFADFKAQFPQGRVLSINTGFDRAYGENPYINYDALRNEGTKFYDGTPDKRLPPKMRVMALIVEDTAVAYPYNILQKQHVIHDTIKAQPLVIFWKQGALSPLYNQIIAKSRAVGSAAIFDPVVDGRSLTFMPFENGTFRDQETGSTWNILGTAVAGPLAGAQLIPLPGHEFFWFAWAAFHPDTQLYNLTSPS